MNCVLSSLLVFSTLIVTIAAVTIKIPQNDHIYERTRQDTSSIFPAFKYYIVPREVQFHVNPIKDANIKIPFFLQCQGKKNMPNFTMPHASKSHLSIENVDLKTITLQLKTRLTTDLVGRYTCTERINNILEENAIYVFIYDGKSIFTKSSYSSVMKQTGVHFFNIPCQTTNWFTKMNCPVPNNDQCIPVYYTPEFQAQEVHFDPQIGFALKNPQFPDSNSNLLCKSHLDRDVVAAVPYIASIAEFVHIRQPSLTVLSDEKVDLTCEIRYGAKINQRAPVVFWFNDIDNLIVHKNDTHKPVFNTLTQLFEQTTTIRLSGFVPKQSYVLYCARLSEQGIYSQSVQIDCELSPNITLEIFPHDSKDEKVVYGSSIIYDMQIMIVPRSTSLLTIDITKNNNLVKDERFNLTLVNNFENQFYEYSLVINNVTFEDEEELTISVKSKILNKKTIKPIVDGDPVAYFSFIPEQIPHSLKWRDDFRNEKIYPYGVFENEIYRVMCSVHHRSDTEKPLNVFILKRTCLLDDCLHNLIDTKSCGDTRKGWTKMNVDSYALDKFRTQFTSIERETVTDPDVGHQYLCCYKNSLMSKGLTAMANDRSMFVTKKPEFSMVTGDILTYGCEAHELIYDEISFVYNDGINTYERKRTDNEWVLAGTTQKKKLDLQWVVDSTKIHAMIVNVSTSPLTAHDSGFIQCKVTSKRSNIIPDITDTYTINVDDPLPMGFITPLNPNPKLYRSSGADIYLDCNHQGRPQPKVIWLKGQQPVKYDSTITFGPNNGSLKINRLQGSDTGYYTCELNNGRDQSLIRSFDLYVKGTNPDSRYRKFGAILGFIFASLLLLMLTLLVIGAFKYRQMKKKVKASQFTQEKHNRTSQLFDENQQIVKQLKLIALPENFATKNQVKTLLGYVNESHEMDSNDFKKLGEGQFGVVYKVRLPDVGFVAAKMLPESIRNANNRKDKGRKSIETEALNKDQEFAKKQKATEMLIEELKVLGKVGQHFNIVGLISVAYPKTELKSIFSGPIRDEDSFYLMELCENGSLESVLRTFNTHQENNNNLETKPSLYKNLSNTKAGITVERAVNTSSLTDDDLKLMAYQVACGVDYLNRKQIAHSDIAPRNVLVTDRFIMKICDFGLATWTTYKNYSEQLATGRVQLEKKHNSTATHNLTPELATAMLRNSSNGGENLLLNKSSMNADVWSFGIFLWCLFLKCKYRPFNQIHREVQHPSDSEYMSRLLRILSSGRVLEYIDYHPEIPREVYAIIRVCLREETERPEMSNIRSYLCHKQMLSRQAFDYYKNEYNQDKEAHSNGSNVEVFGEVQGGEDLPKFNENHAVDSDGNGRIDMNYRDGSGDDRQQQRKDYGYYVPPSEISNKSTRPLLPHSYRDNSDYDQNDSYLQPTTEPKKFPAHVKGTHNIQNDNELENSSLRKDNIMNKPRNDNDNINVTYNTASNTKRLAPYLRGNNDSYL